MSRPAAEDWDKVRRATLVRLAAAVSDEEREGGHLPEVRNALAAVRAEARLRTRAEVDREIAELVRQYVQKVGAEDAFSSMERDRPKLLELVAERLAPESGRNA